MALLVRMLARVVMRITVGRYPLISKQCPKWSNPDEMIMKSILGSVAATTAIVGLSMVMIGSTLAPAEHLTKVTKIYNEVTIGGLPRWNNNLRAIKSPQIYLDVPQKMVSFVRGPTQGPREASVTNKLGTVPGALLERFPNVYCPNCKKTQPWFFSVLKGNA